ncbi:DUF3592 domain-containing protein [uncultured Cohaesibacter sp.]|uniref:DUF3592 domain-containing protein n=1 Tax=uncultured Cohaesibacter sp. TaxID=1002546 RepID=UPI0029308210|nr:DUF3592 domain-containing protein [uncultured Cohaesibacter sp.]
MRYQAAYHYPGSRNFHRSTVEKRREFKLRIPSLVGRRPSLIALTKFSLVIAGLFFLLVGMAHFFTAKEAKSWQQLPVTITKAKVVRSGQTDGSPIFMAEIEYQYSQNGKIMKGDRLSLRPIRSKSPGAVKRQIAAYKVGRTVLAHINPAKPAKAYLHTFPETYLYGLIVPGLALLAMGLAIGQIQRFRKMNDEREAWRFGEFRGRVLKPVPVAVSWNSRKG